MPGPSPALHAVTDSSSGEEGDEAVYAATGGSGALASAAAGGRPTRERKQTMREDFASAFDSDAEMTESGSEQDYAPASRRPAKFAQKAVKTSTTTTAAKSRKRPAPVLVVASSSSEDSSDEDSSDDSSSSSEIERTGNGVRTRPSAPASAAPQGEFRRAGGVKSEPQRAGGKLNRASAVSVAVDWYNSRGPFAGQYTMMKPIESYRNTETSWSLKYFTKPDAGGLFFVRFEYERDSHGMWTVENLGLYEPSEVDDSIESDSSEAEEAEDDNSEEEPDWRQDDGEGTGAKKRRIHKAMMKSAKAARAAGSKKSQAAKKQKHQNIEREKGQMAKARMQFLMKQADVFGEFLGKSAMRLSSKTPSSPSKRHRMTEREEDGEYAKQQKLAAVEQAIPRLTPEQTQTFIEFGKMRDYQVEGLNWMIRLYHRGLNGILADEMVPICLPLPKDSNQDVRCHNHSLLVFVQGLGKTLQTISMLAYLYLFKDIKGPHLVAVPKSTLGNWEREFGRWFPKLRLLKFYGNKEERALQRTRDLVFGKFDVLLTT